MDCNVNMSYAFVILAIALAGVTIFGCCRVTKKGESSGVIPMTNDIEQEKTQCGLALHLSQDSEIDWEYMFMNPDKADDYQDAANLVHDIPASFVLVNNSKRYGHWFILTFRPKRDPDLSILDEEPEDVTFLVDMANRRVVAAEDFEAARPLFDRLLARVDHYADIDAQERLVSIDDIAQVATVIKSKKMWNVEGSSLLPDTFEFNNYMPVFEKKSDKTTITFYISKQVTLVDRQCMVLTITPHSITLEPSESHTER